MYFFIWKIDIIIGDEDLDFSQDISSRFDKGTDFLEDINSGFDIDFCEDKFYKFLSFLNGYVTYYMKKVKIHDYN